MKRNKRRRLRRLAKKIAKTIITPAAYKLALNNDIDLAEVTATGKKGQILKRDVQALINKD